MSDEDQRGNNNGRRFDDDDRTALIKLGENMRSLNDAVTAALGEFREGLRVQGLAVTALNEWRIQQEAADKFEEKLRKAMAERDVEDTRRDDIRRGVKLTKTQLFIGSIGGIGTVVAIVATLGQHT